MKHLLVLCLFGFCLAACSKESDSDSSRNDESSKANRRTLRAVDGGDGGAGARANGVQNAYAERHWPVEEEIVNEWTEDFRAAETPDKKISIVQRKESSGPESLAPLIRLSLRETDERVRAEAVKTLTSFAGVLRGGRAPAPRPINRPPSRLGPGRGDAEVEPGDDSELLNESNSSADSGAPGEGDRAEEPELALSETAGEVVDLVVGAAHDPSSEVRILAMEAAVELPPETRVEIYQRTIEVPDELVRKMTIVELGRMRTKPAFEVLLSGLLHPDAEFRVQVNDEIHILVNRKFESFEQARAWWDGSAEKYAENMVGIGAGG